ncbi:hypothetical protein BIFDEN_00767 [Bifidobacterium dentium ATCC 27678]|nr:hypothetical protein BIFDEN_00767 [Bifidobacterium dentium ATCC 27678]
MFVESTTRIDRLHRRTAASILIGTSSSHLQTVIFRLLRNPSGPSPIP